METSTFTRRYSTRGVLRCTATGAAAESLVELSECHIPPRRAMQLQVPLARICATKNTAPQDQGSEPRRQHTCLSMTLCQPSTLLRTSDSGSASGHRRHRTAEDYRSARRVECDSLHKLSFRRRILRFKRFPPRHGNSTHNIGSRLCAFQSCGYCLTITSVEMQRDRRTGCLTTACARYQTSTQVASDNKETC